MANYKKSKKTIIGNFVNYCVNYWKNVLNILDTTLKL